MLAIYVHNDSTGEDSIAFRDVETGRLIGQPITGITDVILSMAFSADGRTLVFLESERRRNQNDLALGCCVTTAPGPAIYSLEWSPRKGDLQSKRQDAGLRQRRRHDNSMGHQF